MESIAKLTQLHRQMCVKWHSAPVDNAYDGLLGLVCQQFSFNFLLWHEEDIARSRDVTAEKIAEVKRAIDGYNQKRNDYIERIDDWITEELSRRGVTPQADARQSTETAGSAIDRLSILTLRIYHLEEQRDRADATAEHRQNVTAKLAIALAQFDDLSRSAQELLDDLFAGRKRHKTYRQLKMYNDPTMNPYLYKAQQR
ncbi:MAG: DUF4254 domain-containing protein [Pirellulaceae bacterium]